MRATVRTIFAIPAVLVTAAFAARPAGAATPPRARLTDYFTSEDIARASRYRGPNYAYAFSALGLTLIVLALLASPVFAGMRARLSRGPWTLGALRLTAIITLVPALATLPIEIARWQHDRAFGLATNSLGGFLSDTTKGTIVSFVVSVVAAFAFVGIARRLPRAWPIPALGAGALLLFVFVFLLPVIYEPIFNHFAPADATTRARVLAIAERSGVRVHDVLVADASRRTTRENAYVSGLGSTKRVVLYDTLLQKETPREIDLVVAHELAHDRHHDVLNATLLGVAGVWLGIGALWWLLRTPSILRWARIDAAGDPRAVPFLALFIAVATLVTQPITNAISRGVEGRADRTAIAVTNDPQGAIELEVHLAKGNLADVRPNGFIRWMFFTHPATLERIQYALDARASHGG